MVWHTVVECNVTVALCWACLVPEWLNCICIILVFDQLTRWAQPGHYPGRQRSTSKSLGVSKHTTWATYQWPHSVNCVWHRATESKRLVSLYRPMRLWKRLHCLLAVQYDRPLQTAAEATNTVICSPMQLSQTAVYEVVWDRHCGSSVAETQYAECHQASCLNLLQVTAASVYLDLAALLPTFEPSSSRASGPLEGQLAAQATQLNIKQMYAI